MRFKQFNAFFAAPLISGFGYDNFLQRLAILENIDYNRFADEFPEMDFRT